MAAGYPTIVLQHKSPHGSFVLATSRRRFHADCATVHRVCTLHVQNGGGGSREHPQWGYPPQDAHSHLEYPRPTLPARYACPSCNAAFLSVRFFLSFWSRFQLGGQAGISLRSTTSAEEQSEKQKTKTQRWNVQEEKKSEREREREREGEREKRKCEVKGRIERGRGGKSRGQGDFDNKKRE